MKFQRFVPLLGIVIAPVAMAVYAPIPAQEQGKSLTILARAGVSHDDNIFGAASNEIHSTIFTFAPELKYNASATDQTFVSASYKLTLDHFSDRPGDKTIDSHDFKFRVAHSFSRDSNLDITESYNIAKNPESLLAGVPINTDQSYKRNQLDGRLLTAFGPKTAGTIKARSVVYRYDSANLSTDLDRSELLLGAEGSYAFLPEVKMVGEYRRQDIGYRTGGSFKDKQSDFLIGGVDYNVGRSTTLTARLGYEWRDREGAANSDTPYVEISYKHDYAEKSYIAAGYVYTFEEVSNVALYTDTKVNRFFVNLQHALTGLIVASGSISYEPSKLQGRGALVDLDETTLRFGAALSYLIDQHWTASLTFDHDKVDSDSASRELTRNRYGVSATVSF